MKIEDDVRFEQSMKKARRDMFEDELESIRKEARKRHEKARRAARKRGRKDFPDLPFECSWAFEEEFRRRNAA